MVDISRKVEVECRGCRLDVDVRALSARLRLSMLAYCNDSDIDMGFRTISSGFIIGMEWKLLVKNPIHMKVVF